MKLNLLLEQDPHQQAWDVQQARQRAAYQSPKQQQTQQAQQPAPKPFVTPEQQIQQLQSVVLTYVTANPGAGKRIIEFILKTQGTVLKAKPVPQQQPAAGLPHEQPTQFQQALKGGNFELEGFNNKQQHIMEIFGWFNKKQPAQQTQQAQPPKRAPRSQQTVTRDQALQAIRQLRLQMTPHQKTLFIKQLNQIPGVQQAQQQPVQQTP